METPEEKDGNEGPALYQIGQLGSRKAPGLMNRPGLNHAGAHTHMATSTRLSRWTLRPKASRGKF